MMGNYKNNPKEPFVVAIPNKIRKRFAMHYTIGSFLKRCDTSTTLRKLLALPLKSAAKKKGSMWSRFKNFIQLKTPEGRLK